MSTNIIENEEKEVVYETLDYDSAGITADDWVDFVDNEDKERKSGLDKPINRF